MSAKNSPARDVRMKEYDACISEWRHYQNIRYGVLGTAIAGHAALLTSFQATFPRAGSEIGHGLTPENPNLAVVSMLPYAGYMLSFGVFFVLAEWYWSRKKLLAFGKWIEANLKIASASKGHGFFSSAAVIHDIPLVFNMVLVVSILVGACFAWYRVDGVVRDYRASLPSVRRVQIEPIPEHIRVQPDRQPEERK